MCTILRLCWSILTLYGELVLYVASSTISLAVLSTGALVSWPSVARIASAYFAQCPDCNCPACPVQAACPSCPEVFCIPGSAPSELSLTLSTWGVFVSDGSLVALGLIFLGILLGLLTGRLWDRRQLRVLRDQLTELQFSGSGSHGFSSGPGPGWNAANPTPVSSPARSERRILDTDEASSPVARRRLLVARAHRVRPPGQRQLRLLDARPGNLQGALELQQP